MSIITSFVNVIAGASVLLGGKAFMDESISADGPSIRKLIGTPLLGIGALGILVSYIRNKRVREDKKAESDFYEAELYHVYVSDDEDSVGFMDESCSHSETPEDAVRHAHKVAKTHGKGKWVMVVEENRDDD